MATYILVHGSWHGAWCWEKVVAHLEAKGHLVLAPDLPGHGSDKTPLTEITLEKYVDSIAKILMRCDEVILVGHSMAGMIISQIAEYYPQRLKYLVYVTAFLPKHGESMFDVAARAQPSRFVKMMKALWSENVLHFPLTAMKDFAYHLCDEDLVKSLLPKFCAQPLLPLHTKVVLSSNRFGLVPRVYIECLEDRAILISLQRQMQNEIPCKSYSIVCDHAPFYSNPKALTDRLLNLA